MGGISDFFSSVGDAVKPFNPLIGAGLSLFGGERQNKGNIATAREQMDFQREMSNTAHQRQVKDLRAAGLNPILSARYGGASSPGGAMAQIKDTITPAVNTGLQAQQTNNATAKVQPEVDVLVKQASLLHTEDWLKQFQGQLAQWDIQKAKIGVDILWEDLKAAKKTGQINDLKFKSIKEGLKNLTNQFPALKEIFGDFN